MPSNVRINGLTIYKPGVYGIVDASSLGGRATSVGNVAVVGDFPSLKAATPLTFTSPRAVADFHDEKELLTISKLCFSPSVDSRVPAGASTLTLVNVQPNTRAAVTLTDSAVADSLTIQSKLWGSAGNRVFYKHSANVADPLGSDFFFALDGDTETFTNLQSGPVADLYYDGSELDTTTIDIDEALLEWKWTKGLIFPTGGPPNALLYQPLEFLSGDQTLGLVLANGLSGPSANDVTVTIVGIDHAGAPQTEIRTASATTTVFDGSVPGFTNNRWGSISDITISTADAAYNGTLTLSGYAFKLITSDYTSVGAMISFIGQNSNKGFKADAKHPRINKIPATPDLSAPGKAGGLDKQTAVNALSPDKLTARADLWAIVDELLNSGKVLPERASSADLRPLSAPTVQGYLVGGSEVASTGTDWDTALQSIEYSDVQIVSLMSSDIAILKKGISHANASAIAGFERNVWVGSSAGQELSDIFTDFTSQLNSRHVSLVAQRVQIENSRGDSEWKDPEWFALILAGMQAGTDPATPLTFKRPDILDISQDWDLRRDAGDAISKGICVTDSDSLGFRVTRSVTTHLEDDNPVFSEVSANESINTCIRSVRDYVIQNIGNKARAGSAKRLEAMVAARLNQIVFEDTIKAWRNLTIDDLGDTFRVNVEVAPVEPVNFIVLHINAVRIPATA